MRDILTITPVMTRAVIADDFNSLMGNNYSVEDAECLADAINDCFLPPQECIWDVMACEVEALASAALDDLTFKGE